MTTDMQSAKVPPEQPTAPLVRHQEFHPAAGLFPLMPDEQLAALAADIRANGLLNPIWQDRDGADH